MPPLFANMGPPSLALTAAVGAFLVYALVVGLAWYGIRRYRKRASAPAPGENTDPK